MAAGKSALVGALLLLGTAGIASAAEPAKTPRAAWTTSRITGSPDAPPPYKVVRAFPKLKLREPVLLVREPESDRWFVGEQGGILYSFKNEPDAEAEPFCDLRKEVKTLHLLPGAQRVESVYGLAFHPEFARNRHCFVCYTIKGPGRNFANGTRVSRFTVTRDDPPRIDPTSEQIVITFLQGGHNGGDLHFGPDGMLYISTGDAADPNPPDSLNTGQDISDLLGSILRIDVDRQDEGRSYAIPRDNPFVGIKDARPEVWAYGFRNPWRMSFDGATGELFVGDVGWELWEMVHRVECGGNYGWSAMEGPQPIKTDRVGPTAITPPLIELPHTIACSITGGVVYRGQKFPELRGAYVFGDWETRRLWAARFEENRTKEMPELARPSIRFIAFAADKDGELLFLDHEGGTLHTLEKNDSTAANADFPRTLSQSGLFASVKEQRPAPGIVPFEINSHQWHDGATAEHWLALPGESAATLHKSGRPVPGLVSWHNFRMHFPKNAVLARTLSLGKRRIETQILHYDGLDWRAYTYAWRGDQTDADLVPAEGSEKEVTSGNATRLWQFSSRSQCMSCHSNQTEYALAFQPEQLHRPGRDGRNQLIVLSEAGYLQRADNDGKALAPFDETSAAEERKIANPHDKTQPIEARARAWLHANCGHCHSDHGGGAVPLRLTFGTPPAQMKAIDLRPMRGDFGLADACIIKAGDPYASTLYFRMAKFGRDRMPHLGAELPDPAGMELVARWIESLGDKATVDDQPFDEASLSDPRAALLIARKLNSEKLTAREREKLLAAAAKLPPGPVRDLFEGHFPQSGPRKLGSSPRPSAILSLTGDAARGERLFWSESVNCGKCHRVGERGGAVGPELTSIGKARPRDDLLQSLLTPSRRIEPKFATYMLQTTDGQTFSGLVVKRDDKSIVLRDGEAKEFTLATDEIETLRPSLVSLMPDGQLAGLTAQDAADLLEYLAARR